MKASNIRRVSIIGAAIVSAIALSTVFAGASSGSESDLLYPAWSSGFIGKQVHTIFPKTTTCLGNLELVVARYAGEHPGVKLEGWDFENSAAKPVDRILLVDENGIVVGAGEGGATRYDVPKNSPAVKSNTTGFFAVARVASGWIEAWGIASEPDTICRIGGIKL